MLLHPVELVSPSVKLLGVQAIACVLLQACLLQYLYMRLPECLLDTHAAAKAEQGVCLSGQDCWASQLGRRLLSATLQRSCVAPGAYTAPLQKWHLPATSCLASA